MSASCTCRPSGPIREADTITRVRYQKEVGSQGTVWVYYTSRLYDDEREYNCVKMFYWGSRAEDYRKYVAPIIAGAPDKGGRYFAEWTVKKPDKVKTASRAEERDDQQLTLFEM